MAVVRARSTSTNEECLPFADFAALICNVDDHPYRYPNCAFNELPTPAQKFLTEITHLFPLTSADPALCLSLIRQVRTARQDRLGRTLEGVHRAIVNTMPGLPFDQDNGIADTDPPRVARQMKYALQVKLIPEWREHLLAYVDEIDILIWFEDFVRTGTAYAQTEDEVIEERTDAIERMVKFVLQRLQMMNERVRQEEMLMAQHARNMGDFLDYPGPGGHISNMEEEEQEENEDISDDHVFFDAGWPYQY